MEALLVLAVLIALLISRVPIAFALLGAGALGLFITEGFSSGVAVIGSVAFEGVAKYALIVVPMFIAMGIFAKESGLAERLYLSLSRGLKKVPGGLAIATILTCAGFGAVSGSSVATAASIGGMSVDEMHRRGYSTQLAGGSVASAATLAILIPPSIVLVLYATTTGESITQMLFAGIIPGIISTVALVAIVFWIAWRRPEFVGRASRAAEKLVNPEMKSADDEGRPGRDWGVWIRISLIFVIIMGGIYQGFFTVTEASAVGACVAFMILIIDRGRQGGKPLLGAIARSLAETVRITSMIFILLVGSGVLSYLVVRSGLPRDFTRWVADLGIEPLVAIFLILLVLIPLGMFIDGISMLLITAPIIYPVAMGFGFDGIWLGILIIKFIELGMITPPVGLNLFVVSAASNELSVQAVIRGIVPFFVADGAVILLLFAFPILTTWLPSLVSI